MVSVCNCIDDLVIPRHVSWIEIEEARDVDVICFVA